MLTYPSIDPVLFQIGPLAIRWYALAYVAGILGGWWYVLRLIRLTPEPTRHRAALLHGEAITPKHVEDFINWAIIGILAGGRLGYVFFYKPLYYVYHPLEAMMIWKGGMSFHGGMIGITLAAYFFARKYKLRFFKLQDLIAAAAPIGLFFGRISNFINGELYGRITFGPLGMVFPHSDGLPRHPSQLYEAAMEGLVLFAVLYYLTHHRHALKKPGMLSATFLIGYGLSRFIVEFFREPDAHLGFLLAGLSMGQILTIPMVLLGVFILKKTIDK